MRVALGSIETIGLTPAITALDAASKTAEVKLLGYEKVIGAGSAVSVTIHIGGDVAAVKAGVEAGVIAADRVGRVLSYSVIPRPHNDLDTLINEFKKNIKEDEKEKIEGDTSE